MNLLGAVTVVLCSFCLQNEPARSTDDDISVLVYPTTTKNPRYTEGSVIQLKNGALLFAVTEFSKGQSDFSSGQIVGRESTDGGRTWGAMRVLQKNTGKQNVMSVTLKRLSADSIAMFYLEKNGYDDLHAYVRFSTNETKTFGKRVLVTAGDGYHIVNNDRVVRLKSGRIMVPVSYAKDIHKPKLNHITSHCVYSDDQGATWHRGRGTVDLPKRGAMEPEFVELKDGRVLMIVRTQLGHIAKSYSSDQGETWTKPESMGVTAPEAPSTIRRVPSTGDLLLIWNNTSKPGADHGGRRTPLTAAISKDEGETWEHVNQLESDSAKTFAYTSVYFVKDRVLLTYWERTPKGIASRFRSLPLSWFYSSVWTL